MVQLTHNMHRSTDDLVVAGNYPFSGSQFPILDGFGNPMSYIPPNFIKLDNCKGAGNKLILTEEKKAFTLTVSQQKIVAMAVGGHNIFLTGAA